MLERLLTVRTTTDCNIGNIREISTVSCYDAARQSRAVKLHSRVSRAPNGHVLLRIRLSLTRGFSTYSAAFRESERGDALFCYIGYTVGGVHAYGCTSTAQTFAAALSPLGDFTRRPNAL